MSEFALYNDKTCTEENVCISLSELIFLKQTTLRSLHFIAEVHVNGFSLVFLLQRFPRNFTDIFYCTIDDIFVFKSFALRSNALHRFHYFD